MKFLSPTEQLCIRTPLIKLCRPENLKKSRPKKLVKWNKSISRFFFGQIPFIAISKISRKKSFDLFDFTRFFAWTFLTFLTLCEIISFFVRLPQKGSAWCYRVILNWWKWTIKRHFTHSISKSLKVINLQFRWEICLALMFVCYQRNLNLL